MCTGADEPAKEFQWRFAEKGDFQLLFRAGLQALWRPWWKLLICLLGGSALLLLGIWFMPYTFIKFHFCAKVMIDFTKRPVSYKLIVFGLLWLVLVLFVTVFEACNTCKKIRNGEYKIYCRMRGQSCSEERVVLTLPSIDEKKLKIAKGQYAVRIENLCSLPGGKHNAEHVIKHELKAKAYDKKQVFVCFRAWWFVKNALYEKWKANVKEPFEVGDIENISGCWVCPIYKVSVSYTGVTDDSETEGEYKENPGIPTITYKSHSS